MSTEMVTITIDGKEVKVPKGILLVEAAKYANQEIPVFCYHPKLDPAGVCRMCLVEVEGQRKPVTACTMPVSDGMVVRTQSDVVKNLQRGVIEFLLLNHPLDCPVCDKGGECPLQDNTFRYGPAVSRSLDPKVRKPKAVDLGNFIVFDQERCILCRRCTRFDREVTMEEHLVVTQRAHEAIVTTADGEPFNSYFSGNTIELCPVGALTSDLYRFKARPWDLSRAPSVCTGCSVGCNINLDFRFGELLRITVRDNAATDGGWLCDRGRFNFKYVGSDVRVKQPLLKKGGRFVPVSWEEAFGEIATRLRSVIRDHGAKAIGAIGGGRLTNEEAYLFQKLVRAALGSPNIDWRTGRQYVASNAEFPGRITDINRASALLLVDILPAERAPVADLRIRRAAQRGGAKLVAVGPAMPQYRTPVHQFPVQPDRVAAELGSERIAELLAGEERIVALWSGRDPQVGEALVGLLRRLAGSGSQVHLLIPGEQANAWGAEAMGVHPERLPGYKRVDDPQAREAFEEAWQSPLPAQKGWSTAEMLAQAASGGIQALYLAGANLLNTYPDRAAVEAALDTVPFLIVQDLFLTETAEKADVVLPAASFPAKRGHYTAFDGTVQRVERAMADDFDSRTDEAIFVGIAAALGARIFSSAQELEWEMERLAGWSERERLAPAPAEMTLTGAAGKRSAGRQPKAGEDELVLVPVERLFAGGGTAYFDEGVKRARPVAAAAVHPSDAERLGLGAGQPVRLQNEDGAITLTVSVDERVIPGTVQAPQGLVEAPVNKLGAGARVTVKLLKPVAEEVG